MAHERLRAVEPGTRILALDERRGWREATVIKVIVERATGQSSRGGAPYVAGTVYAVWVRFSEDEEAISLAPDEVRVGVVDALGALAPPEKKP